MSPRWRVIHEPAFTRWESGDQPSTVERLAVLVWVAGCMDAGPPGEDGGALKVPLEEEEHAARAWRRSRAAPTRWCRSRRWRTGIPA